MVLTLRNCISKFVLLLKLVNRINKTWILGLLLSKFLGISGYSLYSELRIFIFFCLAALLAFRIDVTVG